MRRRGFLGAILATCAAPAIVRADSLMRVVPRHHTATSMDGYTWGFDRGKGDDNITYVYTWGTAVPLGQIWRPTDDAYRIWADGVLIYERPDSRTLSSLDTQ